MFRKLIKQVIPLMAMIPLLSGCFVQNDSRPREKVIEYDEEVKLHDGSMIWVHIKRHYVLAGGGALGDPGAFKKNYVPKEVEISWDTGFPNVGRKSVFFDHVISIIDKQDNMWFVTGIASNRTEMKESINCLKIGNKIGYGGCVLVLDSQGNYQKPSINDMNRFYQTHFGNILSPYVIEKTELPPNFLQGKELYWQEKLNLQQNMEEKHQLLNKKLIETGVVNYE